MNHATEPHAAGLSYATDRWDGAMMLLRAARIVGCLLACALPLVACSPAPDVVATPSVEPDPGAPIEAPGNPAVGTNVSVSDCAPMGSRIAARNKVGELLRLDLASKEPPERGKVTCLGPSVGPLAMSRDGTVWAVNGGKLALVASASFECKNLPVNLAATAMAFVAEPKLGHEVLYAVVEGVLVAFDPSSFVRSPIGKLAVPDLRGLAGTDDGRLFAFGGDAPSTLYEIQLGDGSVARAWTVGPFEPTDGGLVGGAVVSTGVEVVVGTSSYLFDTRVQKVVSRRSIFSEGGLVAVSGSPCSRFGP